MSIKILNSKEKLALRYIRNEIIHSGDAPSVRDVMTELGYKSPISAKLIIDQLIIKGFLSRENGKLKLAESAFKNSNEQDLTIDVPLVGTAPCGQPFLAEENIEMTIPVSTSLAKPGFKYFLLRTVGDSMNKAGINGGDVVLVKQQSYADDGDIIVALIDDEATIKNFYKDKNSIILKPNSNNSEYKPMIVRDNLAIQGKVISSFSNI
jgi:repressor LexA